jgi:hypothetical protein
MIRKAFIVVLTLASIAMVVLWVDGYRVRQPKPLTPEEEECLNALISTNFDPPDPLANTGLRASRTFGARWIGRVQVCLGELRMRFDSRIKTGTPVPRLDRAWGGFGYKQWLWTSWIRWGQWMETPAGEMDHVSMSVESGAVWLPEDRGEYKVRQVTAPCWFPTVLFAGYPTIAFIRGPVRRWRRRRRGWCLECGYDLTGNVSGVCPECGRAI